MVMGDQINEELMQQINSLNKNIRATANEKQFIGKKDPCITKCDDGYASLLSTSSGKSGKQT